MSVAIAPNREAGARYLQRGRSYLRLNPELAVENFHLAVECGCADAFGELSLCMQYGKGVAASKSAGNERVAFELALQGRALGSNISTSALARCYRNGTGVQKNACVCVCECTTAPISSTSNQSFSFQSCAFK